MPQTLSVLVIQDLILESSYSSWVQSAGANGLSATLEPYIRNIQVKPWNIFVDRFCCGPMWTRVDGNKTDILGLPIYLEPYVLTRKQTITTFLEQFEKSRTCPYWPYGA